MNAAIDNTVPPPPQKKGGWLCSSKFLFTKIGSRLNLAFGPGWMAPVLDLEVFSSRSCDETYTKLIPMAESERQRWSLETMARTESHKPEQTKGLGGHALPILHPIMVDMSSELS